MAVDTDRPHGRGRLTDAGSPPSWLSRHVSAPRRNAALVRALLARRRRDRRFGVVPYDGFQIANALAVVMTALALSVILLDPLVPAWQAALPDTIVRFFKVVTRFGKSDWILVTTGIFCILALLVDAASLRHRLRARRAARTAAAFYVFASVAIPGLIANFAKYLIGRARPKLFADSGSFSFDFWSGDASWASFPSGHATTGMALGVALALLFPRLRLIFLCLGFWIATSRLFVGAHYPSDVLAGGLLGGVSAWLLARAFAQQRLVFGFAEGGSLVRRRGASGRLI